MKGFRQSVLGQPLLVENAIWRRQLGKESGCLANWTQGTGTCTALSQAEGAGAAAGEHRKDTGRDNMDSCSAKVHFRPAALPKFIFAQQQENERSPWHVVGVAQARGSMHTLPPGRVHASQTRNVHVQELQGRNRLAMHPWGWSWSMTEPVFAHLKLLVAFSKILFYVICLRHC